MDDEVGVPVFLGIIIGAIIFGGIKLLDYGFTANKRLAMEKTCKEYRILSEYEIDEDLYVVCGDGKHKIVNLNLGDYNE